MVTAFRDRSPALATALITRARAGDASAFVELAKETGVSDVELRKTIEALDAFGAAPVDGTARGDVLGGTPAGFTAGAGGVSSSLADQRLALRGGKVDVGAPPGNATSTAASASVPVAAPTPVAWTWPTLTAARGTVAALDAAGVQRRFVVERPLSSGRAGVTLLARDESGKRVVIKVPHAGAAVFDKRINTEADAYRAANGRSKFLPELIGCGRDEHGNKALVVEFVDGAALESTAATRGNPTKAVRIAMNLLRAVRALNEAGMRHADLCPGNVFIKDDASESVKAIDLGMAAPISDDYEWGGTAYYAPEQTAGKPSEGRCNADLFSVGALLQHLLTGGYPDVDNRRAIPHVVRSVNGVDVTLASVIERALEPDPARRVQTAQELIDLLRPFSS